MRRFYLVRKEDVSGISGCGRIAEGCTFDNGFVALTWLTGHMTLSYYKGIEELISIHGHEGKTLVEWVDDDTPIKFIRETINDASQVIEDFVEIVTTLAGNGSLPPKWSNGKWFTEPLPFLNATRDKIKKSLDVLK